jgi:hypothetical protein
LLGGTPTRGTWCSPATGVSVTVSSIWSRAPARRSDAFGIPAEAVTPVKQARIRRLAVQWLAANGERAAGLRFDVAAVTPDGRGQWIVDVLEGVF